MVHFVVLFCNGAALFREIVLGCHQCVRRTIEQRCTQRLLRSDRRFVAIWTTAWFVYSALSIGTLLYGIHVGNFYNHFPVYSNARARSSRITYRQIQAQPWQVHQLFPRLCFYRYGEPLRACQNESIPTSGFYIHRSHPRSIARVDASSVHGCLVSHRYRFVYIHVPRTCGRSMETFLKLALCNSTDMLCPNGFNMLQVVDCNLALSDPSVSSYLIWSVVVHPLTRLLYMCHNIPVHPSDQKNKHVLSFQDFILDTNHSHYCPPQHSFLFSGSNPMVDVILRYETLSSDMPHLIALLQSRELREYYATQGLTSTQQIANYSEQEYLEHQRHVNEPIFHRLLDEYDQDFSLFGYNRSTN